MAPPDAAREGAGCSEAQAVVRAAACEQQNVACPSAAQDSDCDGLPDEADPWAHCNRLFFADGFTDPPEARWTTASGGPATWRCGALTLPGATGSEDTTAVSLEAASVAEFGTHFLVELRFTLGVDDGSEWDIGIGSSATGQFRTCDVWRSDAYSPSPGMHLVVHSTPENGSGIWTPQTFDASQGETYVLQSWSTPTDHFCRLLAADGSTALLVSRPYASYPLGAPQSVTIRTRNRGATIDYVRAYRIDP